MFFCRFLLLVIAVFGVSGCQTFLPKTAELPPLSECDVGGCTQRDALVALDSTGRFCRDVQNYYEKRSFTTNTARFGIATVGTIAGSVLSVTSKGSASKAWSGVSGSANGIQGALNETIGRAVSLQQQQAVRNAYENGVKAFLAEADPTNRVFIAHITRINCANGGAEGEAKAVLSIYQSAIAPAASPVAPSAPVAVDTPDATRPATSKAPLGPGQDSKQGSE